jgi:hypothetical protein
MTPKERLRAKISPAKPTQKEINDEGNRYMFQSIQRQSLDELALISRNLYQLMQVINESRYDVRNFGGPLFCLPGIMERQFNAFMSQQPILMQIEKNTQPFKRKKKCRKTR